MHEDREEDRDQDLKQKKDKALDVYVSNFETEVQYLEGLHIQASTTSVKLYVSK